MKKVLAILCVMVMIVASFTGCNGKEKVISITTGGTGGTYYPVGGAIAQTLTDHIEGLTVNSQVGNASVANCQLIGEGETDSALVQNNVAYWAYSGIGAFEDNQIQNLRAIASLYPEAVQIVVLKRSGIEKVEDLKGKKVSVGVNGSGVHFDVKNILDAHDMSVDDFEALYLSFTEAATKLKNNEIDAAFVTAGYPTSSIMDVNLVKDINIVPIAIEKIEKIIEKYPFYSKAVIPADTYSGLDQHVNTVTTTAMWVVDSDVDEETVYKMTRTLWEHRVELESAHEKGKDVTIDTALEGIGIPLHEGAEKYYEEVGIK